MTRRSRPYRFVATRAWAILLVVPLGCTRTPESTPVERSSSLRFEYSVIDSERGGRLAIGDIDGDGKKDLVLHEWASGRGQGDDGALIWYRYPEWTASTIKDGDHFFGDGIVTADLDGDGDLDVLATKGNDMSAQVWWFENPGRAAGGGWKEAQIAEVEVQSEVKDLGVADIDLDGKPDVAVRTKHYLTLYFQDVLPGWTERKIGNREREGMALADLDEDGDPDVAMNGYWLECPSDPRNDQWTTHVIDDQWFTDATGGWQDHSVRVAIGDFDVDTRPDVALAQSEKPGFEVTWYSSDDPKAGPASWRKHEIGVVDYCHTLKAADMDGDGDEDIVAATLKRAASPRIVIFVNSVEGQEWTPFEVAHKSGYQAAVGDVDADRDMDIVTSSSWEDPPVMIWRNQLIP